MVIVTWYDKLSTEAPRVPATSPSNLLGLCSGTKNVPGQGRKKSLMYISLWLENTEFKKEKKKGSFPSMEDSRV